MFMDIEPKLLDISPLYYMNTGLLSNLSVDIQCTFKHEQG